MKLSEALAEVDDWLEYLKQDRLKTIELQKLAARRRSGELTHQEAQKELRRIDGHSPTVRDRADLAKAVQVLKDHVLKTPAGREALKEKS